MRQFFFYFFVLFAHFLLAQTSTISGVITQYQPERDGHFILFTSFNYEKNVQKLAMIDDTGHFQVKLDVTDITEVQGVLGRNKVVLLVDKGDTIEFEMQPDSTTNYPAWQVKTGKFIAANQQLTTHISRLDTIMGELVHLEYSAQAPDSSRILALEILAKNQRWLQQQTALDPIFIRYYADNIHFYTYNRIAVMPFYGPPNKNTTPTDPYFSFAYDPNITKYRVSPHTEMYQMYLTSACGFIPFSVNNNPMFVEERARWGNPQDPALKARQIKPFIRQIPSPHFRDALYKFFFLLYKNVPEFWESPEQMDSIAQQLSLQNGGNIYDIIGDFEAPAVVKQELNLIFAPAKEKPLMLNLWTEDCEASFEAFPSLKKAQTELGNDVAFAHLAGDIGRQTWQTISAEKALTGTNYHLSTDAVLFFRAFFELSGYPHYILIQKGGDFITKRYNFFSAEKLKKDLFAKS